MSDDGGKVLEFIVDAPPLSRRAREQSVSDSRIGRRTVASEALKPGVHRKEGMIE